MSTTTRDRTAFADEFLRRIGDAVGDRTSVSIVFGDPVERDGATVIPVARARFAFGGGGGISAGEDEESGGGGGGAVAVTPVGYIELRGGTTRFKRIAAPGDLLAVVAAGALAALALRRLAG